MLKVQYFYLYLMNLSCSSILRKYRIHIYKNTQTVSSCTHHSSVESEIITLINEPKEITTMYRWICSSTISMYSQVKKEKKKSILVCFFFYAAPERSTKTSPPFSKTLFATFYASCFPGDVFWTEFWTHTEEQTVIAMGAVQSSGAGLGESRWIGGGHLHGTVTLTGGAVLVGT